MRIVAMELVNGDNLQQGANMEILIIGVLNAFVTAGAYILMVGWSYAYWCGEFRHFSEKVLRYYWNFSMVWVIIPALVWPFGIPLTYMLVNRVEHGWRIR